MSGDCTVNLSTPPHAQEVELWEASCYGLGDELDDLINIGTNVNVATGVSTSFC